MGAWALGGQWSELDEAVATVTVHAALYRLQTDYIDVLLCHQADPEDSDLFVESFEQLIEQGLIRAYGVSTMNPGVIEKFDRMGNCGVVQIDYSIVRRGPEAGALKTCAERNIGTQIRGGPARESSPAAITATAVSPIPSAAAGTKASATNSSCAKSPPPKRSRSWSRRRVRWSTSRWPSSSPTLLSAARFRA
ncbi:MAG TPA: aldo/keto reductase [Chloroflexota bacterium]|nr:aldo/keto reductase [Chloroflexota bacterium]